MDNGSGIVCDCCGKALEGHYYEYSGKVCGVCLEWLTAVVTGPCVICRQEGAAMHRYRGDPVHIYCLRGKLRRDIETI
jgi:hypothetical protein